MGKYFSNQEVADLLRKVASAYSVRNEDSFRIRAYEEAAVSIEHLGSEIKDIWDEDKLNNIPAVGKSIAEHIDELFRTGKVKDFEKIFSRLPASLFIFEKIPGIGPKRAFALSVGLKIKSAKSAVSILKNAIKQGKVRKLEGFGEKSEESLIKAISSFEKGETKENRMPLYVADSLAEEIISYLKLNSAVIEAFPLGSLRRMLPTIGDIDIAVSTNKPEEVMSHFFSFPKIKNVVSKGEKLLGRVTLIGGQQVDIRLSFPENFGAMLQYFTGSKQHNIYLREFSLNKGFSLSEYGIKDINNQKFAIKSFENEHDFYKFLGLEWIPPELREGGEEIGLAEDQKLPSLVELSEINGDLHLHSDFPIEPSHDLGNSSVAQMVEIGRELGYQYLGFSEHNPSVSNHTQDDIIDILKRKKEAIEQFTYSSENDFSIRTQKLPIKILNGLEIDIKPNGELAIPEKGFDLLDYAIVSIHSSFGLNKKEMTDRVISGLSHPKVKILGHPTGRKIGEREGFELNWEKIFEFCLKNNKFLEISAWPDRLDLPESLVREAVKAKVSLVINSDSHSAEQMRFMKYGVSVARRGWAEKINIVNALPLVSLNGILL